jgi:hypothetical protein
MTDARGNWLDEWLATAKVGFGKAEDARIPQRAGTLTAVASSKT